MFGIDRFFGGFIEGIYTGLLVEPDDTRTPGSFNTEHSWPQSQGADSEPERSDIHHIFPSDSTVNSNRGSIDFGNTDCSGGCSCCSPGGSEIGLDAGGNLVFEVRPERRGDIARAHFYFAVRYQFDISSEEPVLRAWHEEDPPDAREIERNSRIEAVQNNRNVFVDCPELVARIADF